MLAAANEPKHLLASGPHGGWQIYRETGGLRSQAGALDHVRT